MFTNDDVFAIFLAYIAHTEARLNYADAVAACDLAKERFRDLESRVDDAIVAYFDEPSPERRVFTQSLTNEVAGSHLDWLRAVAEVARTASVLRVSSSELEAVSKRLRDLV